MQVSICWVVHAWRFRLRRPCAGVSRHYPGGQQCISRLIEGAAYVQAPSLKLILSRVVSPCSPPGGSVEPRLVVAGGSWSSCASARYKLYICSSLRYSYDF